MSDPNSPGGSLDDELAAAFDDFGEDGEQEEAEEGGARSADEDGEGGNSASSSEVDLDELGDKGFQEVIELQDDIGYEPPPPKRQRMIRFGDVEELGAGGGGGRTDGAAAAGPSGSGPSGGRGGSSGSGGSRVAAAAAAAARVTTSTSSRAAAVAAAAAACAHPVWVFGLCGVCGVSKEAAAAAEAEAQGGADQYGQYLGVGGGGLNGGGGGGGGGGDPLRSLAAGGSWGPQPGTVRLKHLHASKEVEVSNHEAERIRRDTVSRLLSRRRLILILDLDHTLLNSVHTGEVGEDTAPRLADVIGREEEANLGPRRLLHRLADNKLWTKLRPGVFEFLEGLRDAYEMHIYTMGDKTYAAEVRRLLDPTGRLFASVIAKDHSTTTTAKDLDVLLSADELALVLDDTEMVWPGHRRNLLQIERYHYFPSDLRKWRADGTALLEQGTDESATDGALATHMRVLRAVHTRFFSQDDPSLPPLELRDVRDILAEERRRTLKGCRITFSRCWPQDRNPRREPLWQLAEALGATCLPAYDAQVTTHVVAAAGGTEKVHHARSQGKAVVLPSWLQACSFRWARLPEADFAVPEPSSDGRTPVGRPATAVGGSGTSGAGLSPEEELRVAMAVAGGGGGRGGAGAAEEGAQS